MSISTRYYVNMQKRIMFLRAIIISIFFKYKSK